ncbi:hypothetical protein V8F20_009744 [Naviculisporaceae sp. PSN 640]
MSSRRGSRQSRAFSNFAGLSNPGEMERVVSRNVEINLNGAPGVVCSMQDHTQGTEETIEVTVVPRRRPRKLIVRLQQDESCEDSLASPKVVVTTTRANSRQEDRRHRHQSRSRNEENVAPTGDDQDDDDDDMESLRVNTGRNNTSATAERKTGAKRPSYTEEQNAPSKYTSSAGPTHPAHHDRVYKTDHLHPPPPPSAATGHSSNASSHRLSTSFDLARRLSQLAPWKSSSRAANTQPVDQRKTKDAGNHHRDAYRHSNGKRKGDHDHDHGHHHHRHRSSARSSANPSPTTESFGTPGSYLEDFEHRCHSCGKLRCEYIQKERPVRESEKVRPSLCASCQSKLGSSRHKILGPDGKDLSQKYWCDTCGFLRSTRYHIANGFPNDASRPKDENMCSCCVRAKKRRDEERQRQIEDLQAKLTVCPEAIALALALGGKLTLMCLQKKNTKLNETVGQPAPPSNSAPASVSYRPSSYGSNHLAPPPPPPTYSRHHYRRSLYEEDQMDIDDEEYASHAQRQGRNSNGSTRANSLSNASIRSQKGPTNLAPLAPTVLPEALIIGPSRVATPVLTPEVQIHVEDAPKDTDMRDADPTGDNNNKDDGDGTGGGFINNPSAFWAKLDVENDPMLRACFERDPREAAARRARLAGGNFKNDDDDSDSDDDDIDTYKKYPDPVEMIGPRIVELGSDDEEY